MLHRGTEREESGLLSEYLLLHLDLLGFFPLAFLQFAPPVGLGLGLGSRVVCGHDGSAALDDHSLLSIFQVHTHYRTYLPLMESNRTPDLNDLPDPGLGPEAEDVVLEFVETMVGRFGFPATWRRFPREEQISLAEEYLRSKEPLPGPTPEELCAQVDRAAEIGYRWRR